MNERIKELAFQAMSINQKVSDDSFFVEVSKLNEFEKFAELIVRECMNKTAGYLLEDEFGGSDVKEASEELAKHFGVE
jgi:hypothetical protein